jgi:hypothetical protein
MLTRCKVGMVIVTNRVFVRTTGAQFTLLGELAQHWVKLRGGVNTWIDWKDVAERKADVPGAYGLRPTTASCVAIVPAAPTAGTSLAKSPNNSRRLTSQFDGVGLESAKSSPATDKFPVLGGRSKPNQLGRWNSPTGVDTIKHAPTVSLASQGTRSFSTVCSTQAKLSSTAQQKKVQHKQDAFPTLGDYQVKQQVHGRWQEGSSTIKSVRPR